MFVEVIKKKKKIVTLINEFRFCRKYWLGGRGLNGKKKMLAFGKIEHVKIKSKMGDRENMNPNFIAHFRLV